MDIDLIQRTSEALARGSSYALLAIGFTLVWGVLRRLNLAYGASIVLAVFVAIWIEQHFKISPALLAPIIVVVAIAAGVYVERLCFAPHAHGAAVTAMAASFAVWMQLQETTTLLVPRHASAFPTPFAAASGVLRPEHLLALAVASASAIAFWLLLYRTRFGLATRAVIANRQAASCVGVDVARISWMIFALASALGGIAGYLICSVDGQVTTMFAMRMTLKGIVAAMIGGLGSLPGAIFGGLILGTFESFSHGFLGPQARELAIYLLLLCLLRFCPDGLSALWRGARATPSSPEA